MLCKDLIHPFLNDPGTSQRQRVMDDLLSSSAQIDARKLADLLDYFEKLSRHINYYDPQLNVSDWQPFFQNNLPFTVTSIIKYDTQKIREKLGFYQFLFEKDPSKVSLQLIFNYVFQAIIKPINLWTLKLSESELPISLSLNKLVKDKLSDSLKLFIIQINSAGKWLQNKPLNLMSFIDNPSWNLDLNNLFSIQNWESFKETGKTKRERRIYLKNQIIAIAESFLSVIDISKGSAEESLESSFLPLQEEFKEKLSPHLALLFTFLKLFKHVQNDLNSFTKKHLDFFYKEVLLLKSKSAQPDKVHLIFELQNQVQSYLLEQGLLVKDSKDANKVEIQFSLNNQIVVNRAKIVDKRTLFLNNQESNKKLYLEGVYMASNATMADGLEKPFPADQIASWSTLGSALSKYIDPENKFVRANQRARIGFILASDVLFLQEGMRKINIKLACQINENCTDIAIANQFYEQVKTVINDRFYPINRDLIALAIKKGISKNLKEKLESVLRDDNPLSKQTSCYHFLDKQLFEKVISVGEYHELISNAADIKLLKDIFKPIKAFNISFSGPKSWIDPINPVQISLSPINSNGEFEITISAVLTEAEESIVAYDNEILKEGIISKSPVVRVLLDERVKIPVEPSVINDKLFCLREQIESIQYLSLYHFFRSIRLTNSTSTKIDVSVCGLKNIIVQNSESLQNVKAPIYPFGVRPEVIDFDIKNPPSDNVNTSLNLIGPDFYIGSQELFCKKWNDIHVKFNWKDRPFSFRDYYKGYLKDGAEFGLDENKFLINLSILENGKWVKENAHTSASLSTHQAIIQGKTYHNRRLFDPYNSTNCDGEKVFSQSIYLNKDFFTLNQRFVSPDPLIEQYESGLRNGFLKINLQVQDFCHKVYSYVLARQMMALGKLPDSKLEDAIYYHPSAGLIVFSTATILADLDIAKNISIQVTDKVNNPSSGIISKIGVFGNPIDVSPADDIRGTVYEPVFGHWNNRNLTGDVVNLQDKISLIREIIIKNDKVQAIIPNEPWTPIISKLELDYSATAEMQDIEIVHLYPFSGTYKKEQFKNGTSLFPSFCDEGTLFLGIKDLIPGSNLNILFQLAEATADSEAERQALEWHYLENNVWKDLRNGFEILDDDTHGLTTSGIIKFAIPGNISADNSVLPEGLFWIKASVPKNSRSISETIGIHCQAVQATFTNNAENDKLRLNQGLPAGSIAKLLNADAAVKSVSQPYDSFGGRIPEEEGHFYIRISELLKHKGRAIQKFDYERIALEAFPELFKVKCINHSFALDARIYENDIPMAPGYIILAVIPDLNKLKASQLFEPKVPVSLLENIQRYFQQCSSPFVRLKIMNPRYEAVHFCIHVKLLKGMDEAFFQEKLKQDLREFLAPWAIGQYDKLTFGQCIYRSDIVGFLESRNYLDYILGIKMQHEIDNSELTPVSNSSAKVVCPISPRSILIAGNIDVKIDQQDCERWASDKEAIPCNNIPVPIENYCKNMNA